MYFCAGMSLNIQSFDSVSQLFFNQIDCIFRYLEVLLRRVTVNPGQIVYSPRYKAFVSIFSEGQLPFAAEEYADITGGLLFYFLFLFL